MDIGEPRDPSEKLAWAIAALLVAGVATVIGVLAGLMAAAPEGLATFLFGVLGLLVAVPAVILGAVGMFGGRTTKIVAIVALVLAVFGPAGGCTIVAHAVTRGQPTPRL